MRYTLLTISLLIQFLSTDVLSQTGQRYSFTVISASTGLPVEYANVGVVGKNIGTVTGRDGTFYMFLPDSLDNVLLRISTLGFEPFSMKVKEFRKIYGKSGTVRLSEKVSELEQVTIKPKKYKHKRLGNNAGGKNGMGCVTPGAELGVLIDTRRSPTFIDSVQLNIAECASDSILMRVNIYEDRSGRYVNVLKEPFYVHLARADAYSSKVIDLSKKNIVVEHDFILSVEMVENPGNKMVLFCVSFLGYQGISRIASQGDWEKAFPGFGFGLSAYVRY